MLLEFFWEEHLRAAALAVVCRVRLHLPYPCDVKRRRKNGKRENLADDIGIKAVR